MTPPHPEMREFVSEHELMRLASQPPADDDAVVVVQPPRRQQNLGVAVGDHDAAKGLGTARAVSLVGAEIFDGGQCPPVVQIALYGLRYGRWGPQDGAAGGERHAVLGTGWRQAGGKDSSSAPPAAKASAPAPTNTALDMSRRKIERSITASKNDDNRNAHRASIAGMLIQCLMA